MNRRFDSVRSDTLWRLTRRVRPGGTRRRQPRAHQRDRYERPQRESAVADEAEDDSREHGTDRRARGHEGVAAALTSRTQGEGCGFGQQRGARHGRRAPPQPEQNETDEDSALRVREGGGDSERCGEQHLPQQDHGDPPPPVRQHAEQRRQPVHAEHVQGDRDADGQGHGIRSDDVREVHRSHRHDRRHRDVRGRDREHREAGGQRTIGLGGGSGGGCRALAVEALGEQQRIRAQHEHVQPEGADLRGEREQVCPGERGHTHARADELTRCQQQGPDHTAHRRRPHHGRQVAPAARGGGEVGGGEPRLQGRRVAGADQGDADQQQGERVQRRRGDDDRDAEERGDVARRQSDTPASAAGQSSERDRGERRAQGDRCRREARQRLLTRQVGGQQRPERQRRPERDTREHLPRREHPHRPALRGGEIDARGRRDLRHLARCCAAPRCRRSRPRRRRRRRTSRCPPACR